MKRRLVVNIPRAICIGCDADADGEVTSIYTVDRGRFVVNLLPPPGWALLQTMRGPEAQPHRTFLICASCYQHGAAHDAHATDAAIEVQP